MENTGEYYEASRLQAFSDAVCSIVATILILPLRTVSISNQYESFLDYLKDREELIIVYFVAFLLICSVWESHIVRWIVISYIDDVLVWLNMTSLLFISFLPFAVRLVSEYTYEKIPIVLSCGLLLILELIEMAMVCYTFSQQKLLRGELRNLLPFELKRKRNYVLQRKMLNIVLYISAATLGYVNLTISWVLILLVIVSPCINRLFEVVSHIVHFSAEPQHIFLYENISKERVECFSDGVYAIVATLLVLDITSDNFPTHQDVEENGMKKALAHIWPEYITYVGTFAVCGLLWFVHHSLFYSIKKVNYAMLIINNISLSCVGSLPFLTSLLNKYAEKPHNLDTSSIQFGSLIVGVAGLCQFAIFTLALWNSQYYVSYHLIPVGLGSSRHNYLLIKLLLIPLVAIIIFSSSFATTYVVFITYHSLILATPLLFIVVKLIYVKIFKGQLVIMNVVHENQPVWSTHSITPVPENRSGGTFSPSYD